MDPNELKELRELVDFLKANGIAEFAMEREGHSLQLRFAGEAGAAGGVDAATLARLMAAQTAAAPTAVASGTVPSVSAAASAPTAAAAPADPDAGAQVVKSPIVGTFYDAPSPGSPTFVKVGDRVEVGTVLCIVEAMKLMNEIESDVAGEVVRVAVTAGQPVEYGQVLFAIKA